MTADEKDPGQERAPLFVVKGEASADEIAAVAAVLGAAAAAATPPVKPPRSAWASPERRMRPVLHSGPSGWRTSALPS